MWVSGTKKGTSPFKIVGQEDGNLVTYDSTGYPVWASNTYTWPSSTFQLKMQDDGNLVYYRLSNNAAYWSSNTVVTNSDPVTSALVFTGGPKYLESTNLRFFASLTSSGLIADYDYVKQNLVYSNPAYVSGTQPWTLYVRTDGNLILFDSYGAKWSSNTSGKGTGPYQLKIQNDGNLVLLDSTNLKLWQTYTA